MPTPVAARTAALLIALVSSMRMGEAKATETDPWFGRDKALHFGACAGLAAAGYTGASLLGASLPVRVAAGAGLGVTAGLAKELYDLRWGGDASRRDLVWDVAGTAVGVAVAWAVEQAVSRWIRPSRSEVSSPARLRGSGHAHRPGGLCPCGPAG